MGLGVGVDLEAALRDLRHGVGGGGFDPVHLATEQRRRAGVGLGHGQHHHLVDLGCALGVPIGLVGRQFQALARYKTGDLERARARRVCRKCRPGRLGFVCRGGTRGGIKFLLPLGGRGHEQVGEVDGQKCVGFAGGQLHRQVIDLARRAQGGHARGGHAHLAGVEVDGVLVEHLGHVPHHRIGVEGRAVMELDARPQLEHPLGLVLVVHGPCGGEGRNQHAGGIGLGQIPLGERVIDGDAGEAVALKPLVGLAQRARNVGCRHGNAQHFFLGQGGSAARQRQGSSQGQCQRGTAGGREWRQRGFAHGVHLQ